MNTMFWPQFKSYVDMASPLQLVLRMIETDVDYSLYIIDGSFQSLCYLMKSDPPSSEQTDFETNYKSKFNLAPGNLVTTQFETNDKSLKTARGKVVMNGTDHSQVGYVVIPGTFGADEAGRYISGGWGMTDEHDPDDYVKIYVEDKDRLIATYVFSGATDEWMQANTPYKAYPIVGSYTDDEQPSEDNRGWYFWPTAQGNSLPPVGEVEFEPIGGYAFTPAGMYIKIVFIRPNKVTGYLRFDLYWGQYQSV